MRVGGPPVAPVLVDHKYPLGPSGGSAEGLLHGIPQHPIAEDSVQPAESLRRGVVHGQDEPKVDRIPEAAAILPQRFADGLLVPLECAIALADSVELTTLPIREALLTVGNVTDLGSGSTRVSVIPGFDEEHVRPSLRANRRREA